MLQTMFVGLPVLVFVLGIPLALRLVPPNRFYGYRTAASFASPEAWYQINFATGLALIAAGVVSGICVLALSNGFAALGSQTRLALGVLLTALITLASLVPVVIYSGKF